MITHIHYTHTLWLLTYTIHTLYGYSHTLYTHYDHTYTMITHIHYDNSHTPTQELTGFPPWLLPVCTKMITHIHYNYSHTL